MIRANSATHSPHSPNAEGADWILGVALAGLIATAGLLISRMQWAETIGLSALTVSVVLGMLVGNTVFPGIAERTARGVDFSRSGLLRAGILLYGFRITFQQIVAVGWVGMVIDVIMLTSTFLLAVVIGTRLFKLDRDTAVLIGAGSAICGAAAVAATEPVLRAQAHKVSIAVATVLVFGTTAMFVYPLLYPILAMSQHAYGVFVGSTVHEVAHVVAAARSVSDSAASTAVVEKMLRVMMLAPFLGLLSGALRRTRESHGHTGTRITIPWFAVLFVLASGVNSLRLLSSAWTAALVQVDTVMLAMAMAALGLRTHASAIRQAGARPLLLAATLFAFLMLGGYAVNRGIPLLLTRL
jgi:uncharacterized integral membrane protein (TIGR00698 family)